MTHGAEMCVSYLLKHKNFTLDLSGLRGQMWSLSSCGLGGWFLLKVSHLKA